MNKNACMNRAYLVLACFHYLCKDKRTKNKQASQKKKHTYRLALYISAKPNENILRWEVEERGLDDEKYYRISLAL